MTRAEEKSIAYQLATHGPRVMGGANILSEDEYMRLNMNYDFKAGYEQAEKDILDDAKQVVASFEQAFKQAEKDFGWHSVEESLPPVDEEVIVLRNYWTEESVDPLHKISFGHIVDKNITIDYDGWNVPSVKYWMPMPKLPKD